MFLWVLCLWFFSVWIGFSWSKLVTVSRRQVVVHGLQFSCGEQLVAVPVPHVFVPQRVEQLIIWPGCSGQDQFLQRTMNRRSVSSEPPHTRACRYFLRCACCRGASLTIRVRCTTEMHDKASDGDLNVLITLQAWQDGSPH